MDKKQLGDVFITLSGVAIILAIIGAAGFDIWLASTQWVMIGILLAAYGIYAKVR